MSSTTPDGSPAQPTPPLSVRERKLALGTEQNWLTSRDPQKESLRASNLALEKQIVQVQAKHDESAEKLKNPSPEETVKQHIKLLHDLNEIRDVGLGLIGMVAENRQLRVQEVIPEFGVSPSDCR